MNIERIQGCINAAISCADICNQLIDTCLKEKDTSFEGAITLARECTEVCYASARLLSIRGEHASLFCHSCAEICETFALELEKHTVDNRYLTQSILACRNCAEECRALVGVNA